MSILSQINEALESPKLRKYLMSLFIDTRMQIKDISYQIYREPKGFEKAVNTVKLYHESFPREIRKTYPDLYRLSVEIEDTEDDIERTAIWAAYLDQQTA